MSSLWTQFYWMMYRNLLLKVRIKQLTFQEIFIPLIFVANLATIRYTSQTDPIPPIPSDQIQSYPVMNFVQPYSYPFAFTPNTSELASIVSQVASALNVSADPNILGYASESDILEDVVNGTANISLAIIFNEDFPANLTYKIRLPYYSSLLDYNDFANPSSCYEASSAYGPASYNCPASSYLYSGFSVVQSLVEYYFVQHVSGNSSLPMPDVSTRMFPKGQYDYPLDSLRITASIYIVLAYMPFTAGLMAVLVYEKEKKIKECMKIMGLRDLAFWLAWLAVYSVIMLLLAVIIAGYCKAITIFPKGNFFLHFLGLFLYGLSVVTMAFTFSPLFQKATSAGAMGSLIIMLFVIPYIPLGIQGFDVIPPAVIWILCLFSPTCVAIFFDRAVQFEQDFNGLQFDNMTASVFPPYACIVMLFIDVILYLFLAVYFENVVPGMYGQARSPFFCLSPSFWFGSKSKNSNDRTGLLKDTDQEEVASTQPLNADIEPVSAALRGREGIRIHNMKKIFPGKGGKPEVKAVNGVSLDIFEGQITCLLGHNGAGKSTLINCLTGLTRSSSGNATIYGLDVTNSVELDEIRSKTGVCLQENSIFDPLTPEEHFKFYAGIKGVPKDQIQQKVDDMLELTDLESQRNTLALNMSGGQKRKLCVGMAIIGDPKVLFLDEPSSGMDPYSRRKLWSLLKKQREGRVTLLTTHFMDEADILADRKAIMSKGLLRCCGSSLFLKNKFGVGYNLSTVVDQNCNTGQITDLIQTHVPEAVVARHHGMELSYNLPLKDVSAFAGMFKSLEESSRGDRDQTTAQTLGIQTYGISMTSLEEVFLKIGEEAEMDEADAAIEAIPPTTSPATSNPAEQNGANAIEATNINLGFEPSKEGPGTGNGEHVPASALNGTSIEDVASSNDNHTVRVTLDQSPLDSTILVTHPIQTDQREHIKSLAYIETLRAVRNPATYICRILLPILSMVGGALMAILIDFDSGKTTDTPDPLWFPPSMYLSSVGGGDIDMTTELLYQDSLPVGQDVSDMVSQFTRLDIAANMTSNLSALYDLRPHNAAVDLIDLGVNNLAAQFTAYYNDTAQHSIPMMLSVMSNGLLGLLTSDPNAPDIMVASHPFPKPVGVPEYTFNSGILFVFLFCMGLCYVPIGFPVDRVKEREYGMGLCYVPIGFQLDRVKEREIKVKAQLRISGINTLSYWTSVFIVDIAQFGTIAIIGIVIILAVQVDSLITGGAIFCIILTLILYVPAATMHAYCVGFIFDKFETAQAYGYFFFIHFPLMIFLAPMFVDIFVSTEVAVAIHLVFTVLYPIYSIYGALYFIDKVYQMAALYGTLDQLNFGSYWETSAYIWPTILLIALDNVMLIFFLRFCEIAKTGGNTKDTCPCLVDKKIGVAKPNDDVIDDEDSDVKDERDVVHNIFSSDEPSAVTIQGLRKEFVKRTKDNSCSKDVKETTKVAVRNMSLSVKTGEVMGLLGPNGAGKTTTMNVVTADYEPSRGQVRVGGYDVESALSSAYQALGYCPQIDPLWEEITMREHLEAFAAFKGIHRDDRSQVAEHYMRAIGVTEHADKRAKDLSGGTKRKLCFALSMLGDPQIVLLDEPSTGMDPSSKRFLWNTITSSFVNKKGAILTTHSMEEADAVCSRVGIMISGQLKCLGTTQHLKDKYGGGYIMEIKLNLGQSYFTENQTNAGIAQLLDQKMEVLHDKVLAIVPNAEVSESFAERISYKIPREGVPSLSSIFTFLEQGKQELGIEEYSFSQTTLEQVFIEFAKAQAEDERLNDEAEEVRVEEVDDPHRPSSRRSVHSTPKPQVSEQMDV